jgi:hypothetical protein
MSSGSVFQAKYVEFANDLTGTMPELAVVIQKALAIPEAERMARFQAEIRTVGSLDTEQNPGTVLPGVVIENNIWKSLSPNNRVQIWEYLKLLSMCCFLEGGFGESGGHPWMENVMNGWKDKLNRLDFESLMGKFAKIFGGPGGDGAAGFKMPQLPERFLKGQLAKLAEEIVRDIKPEDIGLTPEMMEMCEKSPSRSFEILMQVFTRNPGVIQGTIKRIGKRLQQKVASGQIRPQDIAREAEEMMADFSENSEFRELLESLKSMFGFEDMDVARASGREGSARLSLVQARLRKKLDARKTGGGAGGKK